jgi:hypothetical protein
MTRALIFTQTRLVLFNFSPVPARVARSLCDVSKKRENYLPASAPRQKLITPKDCSKDVSRDRIEPNLESHPPI